MVQGSTICLTPLARDVANDVALQGRYNPCAAYLRPRRDASAQRVLYRVGQSRNKRCESSSQAWLALSAA